MNRPHSQSHKTGFTIIEVTLVLALAAILFIGVIGGTSANITRQRYSDSVQSLTEFLRRVYSEVTNVQNPRSETLSKGAPCTVLSPTPVGNLNDTSVTTVETGRTNCLVYGKLVTFGRDNGARIHVYDVIGDVASAKAIYGPSNNQKIADLTILDALSALNADVLTLRQNATYCDYSYAGNHEAYTIEWDSRAETTDDTHTALTGSLLIVRSPATGAIHSYYLNQLIDAEALIESNPSGFTPCYATTVAQAQSSAAARRNTINGSNTKKRQLLLPYLNSSDGSIDHFTTSAINICVGSDDIFALSGQRRMIRISADGNNSSAVELVAMDSGDNKCN